MQQLHSLQPVTAVYPRRMFTPFGSLFADMLAKSGISQRAFCRKVGYNQGSLQSVLRNQRPPPLGSEATWADALGLNKETRERFLVAFWLAHAPPQLGIVVERLLTERKH